MITTNLHGRENGICCCYQCSSCGWWYFKYCSQDLHIHYAYAPFGATGQYTYQVIRVPQFFNIQLGGTITTPHWNGSTGGVTVISAVNQLDFNGQTVNAAGAGFRGGGGRALSGQAGLNKNDFYGLSTNNAHGSKGEGVAGTPRYIYYELCSGR